MTERRRGRRRLVESKPRSRPFHRGCGDHHAGQHDEITGDLPQSLQVVLQGFLDQPGLGDAVFLHDGFDLGLGFVGDVGGNPGAHDTWTREFAEV
jgi:hypothetical protein